MDLSFLKNKIYYQDEKTIIVHGDCSEIINMFSNNCVDMIITDPPYGMNYQSNFRKEKHDKIENDDSYDTDILKEFFRISKRCVYVFCRWDNLFTLPKPKSFLSWVKNNWSMGDLLHEHGRQWEGIAFYPQEEHEFIKRIPDVIFADRTNNDLHPTQKPVDLLEKIIECNVGDIILDTYMGSGTTLLAARNLGRYSIGIEISEEYCKIATQRIKEIRKKEIRKLWI